MSNVTMGPGGASILGSGNESNLTTLNGMGLAAGSIPRAANTETRVTGATFDATRGGFAGANIDVRLGPGSRQYQRRNAFITFDPPQLQFTDAVSRSLGTTSGGFRGSVGADGEIIRRALTYNVALDVARSSSDPSTLVNADAGRAAARRRRARLGARLLAIATPLGIPLTGQGVPSNRERTSVSWLGRLDDTRDTLQTRALTSFVGVTKDGAIGLRARSPRRRPPASGASGRSGRSSRWVRSSDRVIACSPRRASRRVVCAPSRAVSRPAIGERVRALDARRSDRCDHERHARRSNSATTDDRWTIEDRTRPAWNANGRRHRFKAMVGDAPTDCDRRERATRWAATRSAHWPISPPGALRATRARSSSRSGRARCGTPRRRSCTRTLPSRFLGVMYGARLEADGFASAPCHELRARGGARSAHGRGTGAPAREPAHRRHVHLQPRPRERQRTSPESRRAVLPASGGDAARRDRRVPRPAAPGILADASAATGLSNGTLSLSCVGAAVPQPDWSSFDAGSSPTECQSAAACSPSVHRR
jgi:hypothetical protein